MTFCTFSTHFHCHVRLSYSLVIFRFIFAFMILPFHFSTRVMFVSCSPVYESHFHQNATWTYFSPEQLSFLLHDLSSKTSLSLSCHFRLKICLFLIRCSLSVIFFHTFFCFFMYTCFSFNTRHFHVIFTSLSCHLLLTFTAIQSFFPSRDVNIVLSS